MSFHSKLQTLRAPPPFEQCPMFLRFFKCRPLEGNMAEGNVQGNPLGGPEVGPFEQSS